MPCGTKEPTGKSPYASSFSASKGSPPASGENSSAARYSRKIELLPGCVRGSITGSTKRGWIVPVSIQMVTARLTRITVSIAPA